MRIAIDVMGGDNAPDEIVQGVVQSLEVIGKEDTLVLVGDQQTITEILDESGHSDPRLEIVHASEVIGMGESPVDAVRNKPDSSLAVLSKLGSVKAGDRRCDAVLSAGNTGATVSAATMHMRRLPGVHRPGIATAVPTPQGPIVLCDVGANPEPRPTHLAQYAVMAETYASHVLGIEDPRVALLNIGSEEAKGTGLVKSVRAMLHNIPDLNYTGFIEGRDVFARGADCVITDGFVGNTMLKLAEGLAKALFSAIAQEVFDHDPELALRLQPVVQGLVKKNDYHEYGGAPLLGINGTCLICHGSSKARTIKNAVRAAAECVRSGVNEAIIQRVAAIDEHAASEAKTETI